MIAPSLLTYGLLLLTIYYVFAVIGMELFSTTIQNQDLSSNLPAYTCVNPNLQGTDFVK